MGGIIKSNIAGNNKIENAFLVVFCNFINFSPTVFPIAFHIFFFLSSFNRAITTPENPAHFSSRQKRKQVI